MPNSASSRTSTGGITGVKPCPRELLHRPPHQRELEEHQRALQVGEARAGHARAGLEVHQPVEQLEVVGAGRARPPPPRGARCPRAARPATGRFGTSGERRVAAPPPPPRSAASSSFSRSPVARTAAIASDASSPARCSSPIRLEAAFFSARSSSSSGSSSRRRASSSSTGSSRSASPRRASASRAESGSSRSCRRSSTRGRYCPLRGAAAGVGARVDVLAGLPCVLPRVLGHERGHRLRVLAHDDVRGHDRAGEAAVADRVEDVGAVLLADVEVRAVGALAARSAGPRAWSRRRWPPPASDTRCSAPRRAPLPCARSARSRAR